MVLLQSTDTHTAILPFLLPYSISHTIRHFNILIHYKTPEETNFNVAPARFNANTFGAYRVAP
jgi:hypothetical protein